MKTYMIKEKNSGSIYGTGLTRDQALKMIGKFEYLDYLDKKSTTYEIVEEPDTEKLTREKYILLCGLAWDYNEKKGILRVVVDVYMNQTMGKLYVFDCKTTKIIEEYDLFNGGLSDAFDFLTGKKQ